MITESSTPLERSKTPHIIVVWSDHDGTYVAHVQIESEAEELIISLIEKQSHDIYGTRIHGVFRGVGVEVKETAVKKVTAVKLI